MDGPSAPGAEGVVREDHVGRQQLGQTGDRDGLGPVYLAHRPHAEDRCHGGSVVGQAKEGGVPGRRTAGVSRVAPGSGLTHCVIAPASSTATMSATPHPATRRRRRRRAVRRRSRAPPRSGAGAVGPFLRGAPHFSGKGTSAGVGRTFALRAAGGGHDRNAKAARPRVASGSAGGIACSGSALVAQEGTQGGFRLAGCARPRTEMRSAV